MLPFLVFLVTRWGGNALIYGVVGATYSAFQLVGAPILGRWSDVHGRRRILLLSQIGTLVSWVILLAAFFLPATALVEVDSRALGSFAITLPLVVLFLARALDGLTGGNISVANAYLSDVSTDENRNANFGKMAVSANLGFIVGPAIAGVLGTFLLGEIGPVLAALLISAVGTLLIVFRLPESLPCAMKQPMVGSVRKVLGQEPRDCVDNAGPSISTAAILRLPGVAPLLVLYFLVMLAFNFFYITFPVWAASGLEWTVRETGVFFSVLSGLLVAVQGPVLGRLAKRFPDRALATGGSLLLAASFLCFVSADAVPIWGGAVLLAVGNGVMWPSLVSMLAKAAGSEYQGAVQGFAGSAGAIASILGLVGGGMLYATLESRVFVLPAAIVFGVFLLSLRATPRGGQGPLAG